MERYLSRVYLLFFLSFLMLSLTQDSPAAGEIQYRGLSGKNARFLIDGKIEYLKPNQTGPQGIKLVFADQKEAIIELEDKVFACPKNSPERQELATTVELKRENGMFFVQGKINSTPMEFVVDTGATSIVLNEEHAKRLKIRLRSGTKIQVNTASDNGKAYLVKLDHVRIAGIVKNNVNAVVKKGRFPKIALLGNTFLNSLNIVQKGNTLVLEKNSRKGTSDNAHPALKNTD